MLTIFISAKSVMFFKSLLSESLFLKFNNVFNLFWFHYFYALNCFTVVLCVQAIGMAMVHLFVPD